MTAVIEAILGYDILNPITSVRLYSSNVRYGKGLKLVPALKMMGFTPKEAHDLRKSEPEDLAYAVNKMIRTQAMRYHPDKCGYDEKMKQVNVAYNQLKKKLIPKHRARTYDDAWYHLSEIRL